MKVSRVNEMRELDRTAIEEYGIIEEILMENAGDAVYSVIAREFWVANRDFVIFCGVGNNGGDGLVVARKLHSNGGNVTVFIMGNPQKFKGAAKTNYEIAQNLDFVLVVLEEPEQALFALQEADVVVDAILGTGLDREVTGQYKKMIDFINHIESPVISVDIPSGINGDTGQVMGIAIIAEFTVTFGLPKIGNLLFPGFENAGELFVTHISFPPELHNQPELQVEVYKPWPRFLRFLDTHKGDYGKALFIAGAKQYLGAPFFAAYSFLKAGGGLSFLAAPESATPFIANKGSEIIFLPQQETDDGSLALENKQALLDFSESVDFVVMGPGLSLNPKTQQLVQQLAAKIEKPLLIDGDGLTAVAADLSCLKQRRQMTILTPHLGEMARITGKSIEQIENDKINLLQQTSRELNAVIVLKGAHTLIGFPDGNVKLNLSGNPGMATAGSGDVLTGIIAAMFTTIKSSPDAICNGVFLHGFAGDLAAKEKGEDGLLAGDILNTLPQALKKMHEDYAEIVENYYGKIEVL